MRDDNTTSNGSMSEKPVDAGVRMGHVHLKVADLERALGFYRDVYAGLYLKELLKAAD